MISYQEYIKSCQWVYKREQRLKIDNYKCQTCGCMNNLEVHHKTYDNFSNENVENDLITLCKDCHESITNCIQRRRYENKEIIPADVIRVTPIRDLQEIDKYGMEKIKPRNWKRVCPTYA